MQTRGGQKSQNFCRHHLSMVPFAICGIVFLALRVCALPQPHPHRPSHDDKGEPCNALNRARAQRKYRTRSETRATSRRRRGRGRKGVSLCPSSLLKKRRTGMTYRHVQSWAMRWALGCVNSCPVARGNQEAGFTQPRAHLIAHLCTLRYVRTGMQ